MGQRAKWLQDERYIRIAGAMLLISPFLNYLSSVALNYNVPDKWALKQLIAGFMMASGFSWLGRVSNFVVGFLMFRGKSSAWVPVLAILGFTIAKNIITFKNDFQTNRFQTVGGLIVNVVLFLLVFESEYRLNKEINNRIKAAQQQRSKNHSAQNSVKQTTQLEKSKAQPLSQAKTQVHVPTQAAANLKAKPQAKEFLVRKGAPIDFDGHGKFAEVFHCTENELWLKVTDHLPSDIHKKEVTLQVPGKKGQIRLKFSRLRDDSTLIFRVIS